MGEQKTETKIPYGKHKGKPVEFLREDPRYLEWLTSTQSYEFHIAVFKLVQKLNREAGHGNP